MRDVRYATLPFLYNDAAAKVREENHRFLGPETAPKPQAVDADANPVVPT